MYYDNEIQIEPTVPNIVRQEFKNLNAFTAADVTKKAKALGIKFSRGVVGTALWRMACSGELYVTNNLWQRRESDGSMNCYWTGGARRVFTWNKR